MAVETGQWYSVHTARIGAASLRRSSSFAHATGRRTCPNAEASRSGRRRGGAARAGAAQPLGAWPRAPYATAKRPWERTIAGYVPRVGEIWRCSPPPVNSHSDAACSAGPAVCGGRAQRHTKTGSDRSASRGLAAKAKELVYQHYQLSSVSVLILHQEGRKSRARREDAEKPIERFPPRSLLAPRSALK